MTISLLILALFMHLLMQTTFQTVRAGGAMAMDADLAIEANRISREIGHDLALSGWHFVELPSGNIVNDQDNQYYPKVLQQDPSGGADPDLGVGLSTAFSHMGRDVAMVDLGDRPAELPGDPADFSTRFGNLSVSDVTDEERTQYLYSHRARSQELVFLRAAIAPWAADPIDQDYELMYFGGPSDDWRNNGNHARNGVLHPQTDWDVELGDEDGDGVADERLPFQTSGRSSLPAGYPSFLSAVNNANALGAYAYLDPTGQLHIETRWETRVPWEDAEVERQLDAYVIDDDHLREFIYAVVPSETGVGRLVRAYSIDTSLPGVLVPPPGTGVGEAISSDGSLYMVVDKVFSDHVSRVVFDTHRTDRNLAINEIRMRLYMAQDPTSPNAAMMTHVLERTFTMHTNSNNVDNERARVLFRSIVNNGGLGGGEQFFIFPY